MKHQFLWFLMLQHMCARGFSSYKRMNLKGAKSALLVFLRLVQPLYHFNNQFRFLLFNRSPLSYTCKCLLFSDCESGVYLHNIFIARGHKRFFNVRLYIVYCHFFLCWTTCMFIPSYLCGKYADPLEFIGSFQVPSFWFSQALDVKLNCHCQK